MIVVTIAVFAGQSNAQQTTPQTNAMIVKEPVFQTNGPYKVQEMMEPSPDPSCVYLTGYSMGGYATLKAVNGDPYSCHIFVT